MNNHCDESTKELIRETVQQTLLSLGLDMSDPIELQKDFAHLRNWRESTRQIKQNGFLALVGIVVTGSVGLFWTAFKSSIH